jgi:Tfp pilus assembly protein PilX
MNDLPLARSIPTHRASERGSAYLFALLVLVVLTVIGLSLALITQTEVQIGGAEKSAVRVLYGADSGVSIQFAAKETINDAPKRRYELDVATAAGATLTETVDTSQFMVMYHDACSLCMRNEDTENAMRVINFVTNAQGRRVGTVGTVDLPQASKLISYMYFVQPQPHPIRDEALVTFDPAVVADDPDVDGLDVIRY